MITNISNDLKTNLVDQINEVIPNYMTLEIFQEVLDFVGERVKERPVCLQTSCYFTRGFSQEKLEKCLGAVFNKCFASGGERDVFLGLLISSQEPEVIAVKGVSPAYFDWIKKVKDLPKAEQFIAFPHGMARYLKGYLSFEPFYKHKDLDAYLMNMGEKLTLDQSTTLCRQLVDIARFVIDNKVEHNDFCLQNILVSEMLQLRLTDPRLADEINPKIPSAGRLSPHGASIFFEQGLPFEMAWLFWTELHDKEVLWHLATMIFKVLRLKDLPFMKESVTLYADHGFTQKDLETREKEIGLEHSKLQQTAIDGVLDKEYKELTSEQRTAFGVFWTMIKSGLKVGMFERHFPKCLFQPDKPQLSAIPSISRSLANASPFPELARLSPFVIDVASSGSMSELALAASPSPYNN